MTMPDKSDYIVYEITECILLMNGKQHKIQPEEVDGFAYGRDFRGRNIFPMFIMDVQLDRLTFFELMKNKESAKVNLKIEYYKVDPNTNEKEEGKKRYVWFNEKFVVKMDDKQFDLSPRSNSIEDGINRTYEEKGKDIQKNKEYGIELYLYIENDLNAAYKVTNRVYSGGDLNTIVTHQLTESGIRKVVMSPLDNKSLTEVVAMPYTMIYNLMYLDAMYGLHSHGTLFFFDLDFKYILNKKNDLTVWTVEDPGREYTQVVFTIRDDDSTRAFMGGSMMEKDKKSYVNVHPDRIKFTSFSDIDDYIHGGEVISVHTKSLAKNSAKMNAASDSVHKKFFHDKYGNPLSHMSRVQDIDDGHLIISMGIQDANIIWFRPYRKFTFFYENPELQRILGGDAKIVSCFVKFTKQGGNYFRNDTTVQFALKKK